EAHGLRPALLSLPTRRSSDLGWVPLSCRRPSPSPPLLWLPRAQANQQTADPSNSTAGMCLTRLAADCLRECHRVRQADCWRYSRSEEHTSELQSRENLVCRLL